MIESSTKQYVYSGAEFGGNGMRVVVNTLEKDPYDKDCRNVWDSLASLNQNLTVQLLKYDFSPTPWLSMYSKEYHLIADDS